MAEHAALKYRRLPRSPSKRHITPCAGSTHVHGVGVGVGDALTTLKLTVIEAPWLPVPVVELHGVAANV